MKRYDTDVPFFANPDETHCYQAALMMVMKRFRPRQACSWALLEKVTGKVEGVGTWPFAGFTWLHEQGLAVTNVELMDNRRFAAEGQKYLAELLGQALATSALRGMDLARLREEAAAFVDNVRCETRIPTLDDIRRAVASTRLVICNVNSRALNGREGYNGHFVVVKGFDDDGFVVHDPGPPGTANRKVTFEVFEKAWAYAGETIKNLVVIGDPGEEGVAASRADESCG